MFCSECGKEINNDVKFCPFCGFSQFNNLKKEASSIPFKKYDNSEFNLDKDQKGFFLGNKKSMKRYLKIIKDESIFDLLINVFVVGYLMENVPLFYDALNIDPFNNYFAAFIITYLPLFIIGQIIFLPFNIAWARRHPSKWGIFVINFLLYWTILGWIIALIWALSQTEQRIVIRN